MSADVSLKKRPRLFWRWMRRMALALLALILVAFLSLWLRLVWEEANGREELAVVVAETNEKDPRWRLEQIEEDLPPIADADNSMLVVKKTAGSLGQWRVGDVKSPDGRDAYDANQPANLRLDEERLAAIRDALGQREPSVALAASLKDFPRGRASFHLTDDMLGTLLPHLDHSRTTFRLLELDAERLAHGGRLDLGPDRVAAILNVTAGLRDDPFLISFLVRLAGRSIAAYRVERLLGLGELSEQACAALQRRFAAQYPEGDLTRALRGERALCDRLFRNLDEGRLTMAEFFARTDGNRHIEPDLRLRLGGWLYSYRLPADHAQLLHWFDEALVIAKLPDEEQQARWQEYALRVRRNRSSRKILSGLLVPSEKVAHADLRVRALMAATETSLAAERFRLANKRWPMTLEELCPAYLPAVPSDPYTGEALRYARHEDGVAVYAVGPDLEDDGGEILRFQGEGNWDVGLRLFDPNRRGLPAEAQQ